MVTFDRLTAELRLAVVFEGELFWGQLSPVDGVRIAEVRVLDDN